MISIRIVKISSQRQTALPRHTQRFLRHTQLRCDIIFISTTHRPVYCQHPWLRFSHFLYNLAQPDILSVCSRYPASIKPEDIQPSILLSKFQNLIPGKCPEPLPRFRIFFRVIGRISGSFPCKRLLCFPVIRTVPVRLGKICSDSQSFFSKRIKHGTDNIRIFMRMKRTFLRRGLVFCICRIPQTEAVVMLGRQNQIPGPTFFRHLRPFLRLKSHRIKRTV